MAEHLSAEETAALRYAVMPGLVPAEKRELLHFLGYPNALPTRAEDRALLVVNKILENREGCLRCHGDYGWAGLNGVWMPCPDCDPPKEA